MSVRRWEGSEARIDATSSKYAIHLSQIWSALVSGQQHMLPSTTLSGRSSRETDILVALDGRVQQERLCAYVRATPDSDLAEFISKHRLPEQGRGSLACTVVYSLQRPNTSSSPDCRPDFGLLSIL